MSVVASVVEYAQSIARAGVAAALAFSVGTAVDTANRVGCYADVTAAAEKLTFVVGGVTGPSLDRTGAQVIVTGLVVSDSSFTVADNGDPTKTLTFQCGSLSSGFGLVIDTGAQAANRTLSVPVLSGNRTLAVIDQAQTFSAVQTISATAGLVLSAGTGTSLTVSSTTDATSSTAASVTMAGGLAVAKGAYVGTFLSALGGASSIVIEAGSNARAINAYLNVNAAAGYTRAFTFQTGGSYRWLISCNSVAETGSNAGSDFSFNAYDDAGSLIDQPFYIPRAGTGFIVIRRGLTQTFSDAATSTISAVSTHSHNSSGTPAAGFGSADSWYLETTTTIDTVAFSRAVSWVDATHASRKARVTFNVYDTATRECLRLEASGSAPMIGFLGASAVVRATMAAATGTEKRTTYDTATVTLPELAGVVMALITDSRAYGLHG